MIAIRWPWLFEELDIDITESDSLSSRLDTISNWMCERYCISEDRINRGYCFIWAFLAYGAVSGSSLHNDCIDREDSDHAFIGFRGRFYDSEHTYGVLKDKALMRGMWMECDRILLDEFCAVWIDNGRYGEEFQELLKMLRNKEKRTNRRTIRRLGLDF